MFVVTLFLLPETKGRSLEALVPITDRRLNRF
jgi:hypothetical protein